MVIQSQEASPDQTGIMSLGSGFTSKAYLVGLWKHLGTAITSMNTMAVPAFDDLSIVTMRRGTRLTLRGALFLVKSKSHCYK